MERKVESEGLINGDSVSIPGEYNLDPFVPSETCGRVLRRELGPCAPASQCWRSTSLAAFIGMCVVSLILVSVCTVRVEAGGKPTHNFCISRVFTPGCTCDGSSWRDLWRWCVDGCVRLGVAQTRDSVRVFGAVSRGAGRCGRCVDRARYLDRRSRQYVHALSCASLLHGGSAFPPLSLQAMTLR
jgi:hypothetical protein